MNALEWSTFRAAYWSSFRAAQPLNAEIVKQGYGHAYVLYPFKYLDQFRAYEREAREGGRGLWGGSPNLAVVPGASTAEESANPEQLVYVTRTGTKYHREGCRFLARSQIPIALKNVGSRTPCSVCNPPRLRNSADKASRGSTITPAVSHTPFQTAPTPPADSGRCQATTKKGTQCSRRAQPGSHYCWQHQR
jgi:hypothetical protein